MEEGSWLLEIPLMLQRYRGLRKMGASRWGEEMIV